MASLFKIVMDIGLTRNRRAISVNKVNAIGWVSLFFKRIIAFTFFVDNGRTKVIGYKLKIWFWEENNLVSGN